MMTETETDNPIEYVRVVFDIPVDFTAVAKRMSYVEIQTVMLTLLKVAGVRGFDARDVLREAGYCDACLGCTTCGGKVLK